MRAAANGEVASCREDPADHHDDTGVRTATA